MAISAIYCGQKGLIMCKGMINLTMAINTVYVLTHFTFSYSLLYVYQLAIVACEADRRAEPTVLLDSVL